MCYDYIIDNIYIIYLGILIFGVILFSILNFRVLKDIKNSFNEYRDILEKNVKLTNHTVKSHYREGVKLEHKVKHKL